MIDLNNIQFINYKNGEIIDINVIEIINKRYKELGYKIINNGDITFEGKVFHHPMSIKEKYLESETFFVKEYDFNKEEFVKIFKIFNYNFGNLKKINEKKIYINTLNEKTFIIKHKFNNISEYFRFIIILEEMKFFFEKYFNRKFRIGEEVLNDKKELLTIIEYSYSNLYTHFAYRAVYNNSIGSGINRYMVGIDFEKTFLEKINIIERKLKK